mgnify:CR=1 FL=1
MDRNRFKLILPMLLIIAAIAVAGCQRSTLDVLRERVKEHPDNPQYHNDLAYHLEELKRYEEAIAEYNNSLELRPDDFLAMNNKGTILYKIGRYEEALKIFLKLQKQYPDRSDLLSNIAMCYHNIEQFDKALEYYILALKSSPTNDPAKKGLQILQEDVEATGQDFDELKAQVEQRMQEQQKAE